MGNVSILRSPRSGFSIVMVLMASVIMGFIAVAFIHFFNNSGKAERFLRSQIEFDNLMMNTLTAIRAPRCKTALYNGSVPATFGGGSLSVPLNEIKVGASTVAKVGQNTGTLTINNPNGITLTNTGVAPLTVGPVTQYVMRLLISGTRSTPLGGGIISNAGNPILVTVNVNGSTVVDCGVDLPKLNKPQTIVCNFASFAPLPAGGVVQHFFNAAQCPRLFHSCFWNESGWNGKDRKSRKSEYHPDTIYPHRLFKPILSILSKKPGRSN